MKNRRYYTDGNYAECIKHVKQLTAEIQQQERALIARDWLAEDDALAERLSSYLGAFVRFLKLRETCKELERNCETLTEYCNPETSSNTYWRSTSHGFGNSCDSILEVVPSFAATLPTAERVAEVKSLVGRASSALGAVSASWQNHWHPVIRRDCSSSERYKEWKRARLIPYGGREALAILRVWSQGGLSANYGDQEHQIFGLRFGHNDAIQSAVNKVMRKLRIAKKRGVIERKGAAPSLAGGRRLMARRWRITVDNSRDGRRERVWQSLFARRDSGALMTPLFGAATHYGTGSCVRDSAIWIKLALDDESRRIHRRGVRWIGSRISDAVVNCRPACWFTGAPEQLTETDYAVPAQWSSSNAYGNVERGYLILRIGSTECYHMPQAERDSRELGEWSSHAGDWSEDSPPWPDQIRSLMNDREEQRRRAQSRYGGSSPETSEERKRRIRSKTAELVRKLRKLAAAGISLTPHDSYAVSNCRPGTREFMQSLSIDTERIAADDILKRWRSAGYIQRELFGRVVEKLAAERTSQSESLEVTQ